MRWKEALSLVLLFVTIQTMLANAAMIGYSMLGTSGVFVTVDLEVWGDPDKTILLTSINWGDVYPGEPVSKTVYVESISNVPGTLTIDTANYEPTEAGVYLHMTHNYDGSQIPAGGLKAVTFTLTADIDTPETITSFSFDIILRLYGVE